MSPAHLPTVAIVGRPNVGKSTLFNRILAKRIAIVEDVPGVTRDRVYGDAEWGARAFTVVDTGGLVDQTADEVLTFIREQAMTAIAAADAIVFLVDAREGLTAADEAVAEIMRPLRKPTAVAANKTDHPSHEAGAAEFHRLGLGEVFPISSVHGTGVAELLDALMALIPEAEAVPEDGALAVAIIGRPNVGKSSLVNALLGEERLMVQDQPGTTRDAVDVAFHLHGQDYTLIDTAGLRKRTSVVDAVEKHATGRAVTAIERCDVAVLLLDAAAGLVDQDKRLATLVHRRGRGLVVALNKWDLVEKDTNTLAQVQLDFAVRHPLFGSVPFLAISVLERQRLGKVFDSVNEVAGHLHARVATSDLNRLLEQWIAHRAPPMHQNGPVRIKYATQTGDNPPTFTLFANRPGGVGDQYLRYLEGRLRRNVPLSGVPVRWQVRASS